MNNISNQIQIVEYWECGGDKWIRWDDVYRMIQEAENQIKNEERIIRLVEECDQKNFGIL